MADGYSLPSLPATPLPPSRPSHPFPPLQTNPFLADKLFTVGGVAPRIGGMRVVPTSDDEVLLETSMIWGSQAQVRGGEGRVGGCRFQPIVN